MAEHKLCGPNWKPSVSMVSNARLSTQPWRFEFDSARRRFGICRFGLNVIGLSRVLTELNDEAEVRDIILHEIAHALAGPRAGHGPLWKAQAAAIGARPQRCYSDDNVVTVEAAWQATCWQCNKVAKRHKNPCIGSRLFSCSYCSGSRYNPRYRLTWYRGGSTPVIWRPEVVQQPRIAFTPATPAPVGVLSVWKPGGYVPVAPVTEVRVAASSPAPVVVPEAGAKHWNPTVAVALYKAGSKLIDIAAAMGYPRGSGQTRVRRALESAGVWHGAN